MRARTPFPISSVGALLALLAVWAGCTSARHAASTSDLTNYHGWSNAVRLGNGIVEVIAVPEIGRVMSFRFIDGENVFWEDRSLDGGRGDAAGKEWVNFGGDKTWPAPEADWGRYTGRKEWMPPPAFDALPVIAKLESNSMILTSPVDPFYGIRTIRRVRLMPGQPAMTIETTYERVSGQPSKVGIWVITQFKNPVGIYVAPPAHSVFPNGYFIVPGPAWPALKRKADGIEITRDPTSPHKIGSDADRLLWVGEKEMCLVVSPRVSNAEYPDGGASGEVYTNPDPKPYIEIETLGPLALMKPGDKIARTNRYTLFRRTTADAADEARRLLH